MVHDGIDAGAATALSDLASMAIGTGAPFGLAALIGAFAVAGFGTKAYPSWLTRSSAVIAFGLISPTNWIVFGLAVIWIPLVSANLYRETKSVELSRAPANA